MQLDGEHIEPVTASWMHINTYHHFVLANDIQFTSGVNMLCFQFTNCMSDSRWWISRWRLSLFCVFPNFYSPLLLPYIVPLVIFCSL